MIVSGSQHQLTTKSPGSNTFHQVSQSQYLSFLLSFHLLQHYEVTLSPLSLVWYIFFDFVAIQFQHCLVRVRQNQSQQWIWQLSCSPLCCLFCVLLWLNWRKEEPGVARTYRKERKKTWLTASVVAASVHWSNKRSQAQAWESNFKRQQLHRS